VGQSLGAPCGATQRRLTLAWEATGTDGVRLAGEGSPGGTLPPSGRTAVCRDQGDPVTYTLTATGPGGSTAATTAG
jgi:hypothetical protein